MPGCIKTKKMQVELQENGIIRNKHGIIIARLVDGIEFSNAEDYDKNIHSNPDAMAWAKFYKETFPEADLETMHGWFANAMMAMHDHIYQDKNVAEK